MKPKTRGLTELGDDGDCPGAHPTERVECAVANVPGRDFPGYPKTQNQKPHFHSVFQVGLKMRFLVNFCDQDNLVFSPGKKSGHNFSASQKK